MCCIYQGNIEEVVKIIILLYISINNPPFMDLYAEEILDHYRHPRHKKSLNEISLSVMHEEKNPACGDTVRVGLMIEKGIIQSVLWDGEGCAISQATMSMLSDKLEGKSLQELDTMNAQNILNLLNVPISKRRIKCALLSLHALHNTLQIYRSKAPYTWADTVGNTPDPS